MGELGIHLRLSLVITVNKIQTPHWVAEDPSPSWHCLTPASSQNTPPLFTCLSRAPGEWQPISDFKIFVLALFNAWNILAQSSHSRMAFPEHLIYTHLPTSGLHCYPTGQLLLPKIIAIKRFFIHLSPLDCKTK